MYYLKYPSSDVEVLASYLKAYRVTWQAQLDHGNMSFFMLFE